LIDAKGVTNEELKEQAASLGGAVMPNLQLEAGRYHTKTFEPPLSFEVGEGWELMVSGFYPPHESVAEEGNKLSITHAAEGGNLTFTSLLSVFDPSNASEPKSVPAPKTVAEWISWFQKHPNLKTSKPVSVHVGAIPETYESGRRVISGRRIDVTVTSTPESSLPRNDRGQSYVPLYPTTGTETFVIHSVEGVKSRFFVVNVRGKTVIIDVNAPVKEFDAFLSKAQQSLDTIVWEEVEVSSGEDG
jgi:hypothetical protein